MKNLKEITHEITDSGLKIYRNEIHVKTIPSKYVNYYADVDFDETKKRLNNDERSQLEVKYFESVLKISEPYVYELIAGHKPINVQEVNNQGLIRYEIIYSNNVKLRIDKDFYDMFPNKIDVRYSNY